uniref:Uncharacterized protein n=1 Tax=Romanomermis culicivorax TaxID=13658 RepID=A0A915I8I3_ROMCU
MYARPPNLLPPPICPSPQSLGQALAAQPTPNFHGYTLFNFDTESIMAADMQNFQFAVPMPADSTVSSYPQYVQFVFPNDTMFVFETFTATLEDWTALFSLVDSEHTIVVSFNGADDRREYTLFWLLNSRPTAKRRIKTPLSKQSIWTPTA